VRLTTLLIQNFLSFGEMQTIDLQNRGLVLIEGENRDDPSAKSNGSGKSAIVDAVLWCLYGVTTRGYEADDVINRKVGKDCLVELQMVDANGQHWRVVRYRKCTTRGGHKTGLDLMTGSGANGAHLVGVSAGSVAETQEKIDKLLGMTATTFASTVIFGQGAAYRFSLLGDKEQKAILDQALGIENYARAGELAREESLHLRRQLDRQEALSEASLDALKRSRRRLKRLKASLDSFAEDKASKLARLKERRAEILSGIDRPAPGELETLRARLRKVQEKLAKVRKDYQMHVTLCARMSGFQETAAQRREETLAELKTAQQGPENCDACGRPVTQAQHRDHLALLATRHEQLREKAARLQKEMEAENQLAHDAKQQVDVLTDTLEECRQELEVVQRKQTRADAKAEEAERLAVEIEELAQSRPPLAKLIAEEKKAVKRAKRREEACAVEISRLKKQLDRYAFWVEAFSARGLRSLIIDNALPFLNDKAVEYSEALSDGNLKVNFDTQSTLKSGKTVERFEVGAVNAHGASDYKGHSAGEKAKVDLIVGLALQALVASRSSPVNVAFFDEPFEHLDDTAMERVAQLLTTALGHRESVFVITHNDALKAHFPATITVVKQDGFSTVE
jgi:DNA repair exonuclease SbcCD ATPase subunit